MDLITQKFCNRVSFSFQECHFKIAAQPELIKSFSYTTIGKYKASPILIEIKIKDMMIYQINGGGDTLGIIQQGMSGERVSQQHCYDQDWISNFFLKMTSFITFRQQKNVNHNLTKSYTFPYIWVCVYTCIHSSFPFISFRFVNAPMC